MDQIPGKRPTEERPWIEIEIHIKPEAQEAVGQFLFDLGCTGLVTEGLDYSGIKAYFPPGQDKKRVEARLFHFFETLRQCFPDVGEPVVCAKTLAPENWGESWKKFFKKKWVSPKLLIVPAWESVPVLSKTQNFIIMDPGPAFGTGQHPTTVMCLKCIERLAAKRAFSLVDVGTGSGILAIYGAKLGASEVMGIDIDLEAIRWAKRNAALNGLEDHIEISTRPLQRISRQFDLVVANLIMREILKIMDQLVRITMKGGHLVLSGLLREQTDRIGHELESRELLVVETITMNEWATVVAKKS